MSDEKTKIECGLVTRGTTKANSQAVDDLTILDPDPIIGKRIVEEGLEKDIKYDSKSEDS